MIKVVKSIKTAGYPHRHHRTKKNQKLKNRKTELFLIKKKRVIDKKLTDMECEGLDTHS